MLHNDPLKVDKDGDTMMGGVDCEAVVSDYGMNGFGGDFILPFGIHKGHRLRDVPTDYLRWLVNNLDMPSEILKKSLAVVLEASKGREMEIDWIAPPLSTAPDGFHEWGKLNRGIPKGDDTALWINNFGISKYFNLNEDILKACKVQPLQDDQTPQTDRKSSPKKNTSTPRYALYHIWDLSKRYLEHGGADAAVEKYINEVLRGIGKGSPPRKERGFGRY
ncbi:hypothetical protein L207DRAFT_591007 [Hyaloscypha variabilis F]|jgi:uncharacterized protein (DUF3820 family)|uniref:Uncharacterized protein n=1 Tax=Hyaloscypha variabilis (strain UAMH 11265 / GT02V1 / F) TaxID=1149755 RepID=A0A2J6R0U1_HYAVF|nr:hypothetical protein L207DRAFT_591007 [Hyaloscypha variabilis F]